LKDKHIPKRLEVAGITQAVIPEVFYRESSGMTGFLLRACRAIALFGAQCFSLQYLIRKQAKALRPNNKLN